ncbi:MAG: phage portal protein [Betaproteobacteria bacterium]|nr:phage portal protein [Betaproteobacteria bacterium]
MSGAFVAGSRSNPDLRRWNPVAGSPDADILSNIPIIASRARDLQRNHPLVAGALQTNLDNILGGGLWLAPMPDYEVLGKSREWAIETRTAIKALWRGWADTFHCDATRSFTLDGLAQQMFVGAWMNGDGVALPLWLPRLGSPAALRIQTIESDRLCNPQGTPDTATLRGGIEIDAYGAPVAYNFKKSHPGDRYFWHGLVPDKDEWERIPAETWWGRRRVIHMPDSKIRSGQTRGVSALASVMRTLKVAGDYTNHELKAAAVNAMIAVITESSLSQDALLELLSNNEDARQSYIESLSSRGKGSLPMEGGTILPLMLGEKVSSFNPSRPNTAYEPFMNAMGRYMAAGLNMPFELFMKDFSQSNYSSARAALLEGWRFFTGRRQHLALYFYQPVYELFLEEMVDAGKIDAPDFYENKWAYCRARWVGPGRGWIDPLKEAEAAGMRMELKLSSLEDECAEQGKDWQEVLEQIAAEREYAETLGVDLGQAFGARAPQPAPQPDRESDEERQAREAEEVDQGGDKPAQRGRKVQRETTRPAASRAATKG